MCAAPTTITYNSVLYTATTQYQTLTITNCPCTLTQTSVCNQTSEKKKLKLEGKEGS